MHFSPRLILLTALLFAALVPPAEAQYLYLDANRDSVWTTADQLNPDTTTVLVWLNTNHDRDGSIRMCNDHTGASSSAATLNVFAYDLILHATGGTVSYSAFTSPGFSANGTEYHGGTDATVHRTLPLGSSLSGLHLLGYLTVTVASGSPAIDVANVTSIDPAAYGTGFGTDCDGSDYANTYVLGTDWIDTDGVSPPVIDTFQIEVTGDGVGGPMEVTASSCLPASSQYCNFTAYPSIHMLGSQGCAELDIINTVCCNFSYTCNGQLAKGKDVTLEVYAKQWTGGHCHEDPSRPTGNPFTHVITTDSVTGIANFCFETPEVAGVLNLVFYSTDTQCPFNEQRDTIYTACVLVPNLVPLASSPNYTIYAGSDLDNKGPNARHPDFHYLRRDAMVALHERLGSIRQTLGAVLPPLEINDISLEWGGLFDISEPNALRYPVGSFPNWIPPHCGHRYGTGVDIRLENIPAPYRRKVKEMLTYKHLPPHYYGPPAPGFSFLIGREAVEDHIHLNYLFN